MFLNKQLESKKAFFLDNQCFIIIRLLLNFNILQCYIRKRLSLKIFYKNYQYYTHFGVILHPTKKVNMKKFFLIMLAGMMLFIPEYLYAGLRTYSLEKKTNSVDPGFPSPTPTPHRPQMPSFNPITVEINEDSGEMCILFNCSIDDVNITITNNGTTIENNNINAICGQCIIYNMNSYEKGQYILTIESGGNILSQYEISIYEE